MMIQDNHRSAERSTPSLPFRYLVGLLVVLILSLAVFYLIMHPPMGDLSFVAGFLGITTAISGILGFTAHRRGWLERMPSLRTAMFGSYLLASMLSLLAVWLTARLMFSSVHDLQLATVLLIFAAGMAIVFGYFLASTLGRRIQRLKATAEMLAAGDLSARAEVVGKDELAALGKSFNEMAEHLQEANDRQRELDQLRRDLVAWASHDLQTPLTAIRLQVEALADGLISDPESVERYLRGMQRQVKELSLLLDDLFQMAQVDAGGLILNRSTCSISDLISDTLESYSTLAESRGVRLRGEALPGVDPVSLDAPRFGRAVNNLVANALRHTPSGGEVLVRAHRDAGVLTIEVIDTGEGIAAEDLPHIFERFYRGEKSRSRMTGGAGLGLTVVDGIVRAHGGNIRVESRLGSGTTFRIQLPG